MKDNVNGFISRCLLSMLEKDIKITLSPNKFVTGDDNVDCLGWFDPEKKIFSVAMGHEDWLEIFTHEYCHFLQYLEGMFENYDDTTFWKWLDGKEFPLDKVEKAVRAAQKIEADNERRTLNLIIQETLPINTTQYIKKCNGYIMSYDVFFKNRSFGKEGRPTYSTKEILDRLNGDVILKDEELTHPPEWFHKEVSKNLNA